MTLKAFGRGDVFLDLQKNMFVLLKSKMFISGLKDCWQLDGKAYQ